MPKWLFVLLQFLWPRISEPLRRAIEDSIRDWEAKAKETSNDLDDVIVAVVKWIMGIE